MNRLLRGAGAGPAASRELGTSSRSTADIVEAKSKIIIATSIIATIIHRP